MTLILSNSRALRFFSFTVFYVAQGLPFGLVQTAVPAYLASQGVSAGEVGAFIGISLLPWTFKIFAGPIMDRFTYLAMGRRRPWVIGSQICLVLIGFAFMFFPNALENLTLLTALFFVLNCFTAVQDVAIDGMAIDVLEPEEHGRANAFMAFGQLLGITGGTAIGAFALIRMGITGVALILVLGFSLILFWCVTVRERESEKLLPWTQGQPTQRSLAIQAGSWKEIVFDLSRALFLPASVLILLVNFLFRFSDGVWGALVPIVVVQDLGYQSDDYSYLQSLANFIAAVAGLVVGLYIDRKGVKLLYGIALALYGTLALAVGLLEFTWQALPFLLTVLFLQAFIYQAVFISFIASSMNLCWVKVAATQFAIYMAFANLGRSSVAGTMALLEARLSYEQIFMFVGLAFFVAVALLWSANIRAHHEKIRRLELGAGEELSPDFAPR